MLQLLLCLCSDIGLVHLTPSRNTKFSHFYVEWILCSVFDYKANSTTSEVKTLLRCISPEVQCRHPAFGDLLLNLQDAPNLKGNCLYGVLFKTAHFT